jgi:hypothetical protein
MGKHTEGNTGIPGREQIKESRDNLSGLIETKRVHHQDLRRLVKANY